ncbi:hypothetical protein za3_8 [Zamilon virus]|uniref:Uncharacterized protein n=1 Tax=Zamilon virus TaxID=1411887 RepID=A0A2P1EHI5_9VIRU|nr:hypothetical protein za3_8 [Zamilon virus]
MYGKFSVSKKLLKKEQKKLESLRNRAENDLIKYLDKQEEENEEIDPETPIYWIELEECKSIEDINEFMKEFGW